MSSSVKQPSDFLRVKGDAICLEDKPVILRGAGLGGWMNMENFITGYPGHEHQVRAGLLEVLGQEKYDFFFDKFLEYFFTEPDAAYFASLGLNAIRLPINYRHFEDDMNPGVFKKEGLKHLDRVIDICAKYGIYTVIDLHALPGGQNIDWHADAGNHQALFWDHLDFQNRAVKIWENLAEHYKDNKWIAGYNPLNEPTDEKHTRLLVFMERVEKAIRRIDSNHILFWDGNTFGADFRHFKEPLPNSVYACHDYSVYGFPSAPELYTGTKEQDEKIEASFDQKVEYMRKIGGPIWNGEFGPVYQNEEDGLADWQDINKARYGVLKTQLEIYDRAKASWSIWLYKDIGFQGMTFVGKETEYIKLLKPFLEKKKRVACDAWGVDDTPVRELFEPIETWFDEVAPHVKQRYPRTWARKGQHLARLVRNILLSEELVPEYCAYFKDKSIDELDALAKSFHFDNCQRRDELNAILSEHKS